MIGGIKYIPISTLRQLWKQRPAQNPNFIDIFGNDFSLNDWSPYMFEPISSNEIIQNEYVPQFNFNPIKETNSTPVTVYHPSGPLSYDTNDNNDHTNGGNNSESNQTYSNKYTSAKNLRFKLGEDLKGKSSTNYTAWNRAWEEYGHLVGIKDDKAYCFLLGQIFKESGRFVYMEEIHDGSNYDITKNPKKAKNLGNTQPGDGKKYKGRGPIQVTGKANYEKIYKEFFVPNGLGEYDVVSNPGLAKDPYIGSLLSIGWLATHKNAVRAANRYDIESLTRNINGGLNGFSERRTHTKTLLSKLNEFEKMKK